MKTPYKILYHLYRHQDEIISGGTLADRLGISRNQIWKGINQLREEGYVIDSFQSHGYRLKSLKKSIDPYQIQWHLEDLINELEIMHYKEVTSTNNLAKEFIIDFPQKMGLIIADQQNQGRGRAGRDFYSQLEQGLYLSFILPIQGFPTDRVSLYTLAAGLAMGKALETIQDYPIQLKWVNDLFIQGKKIGGILCEATTSLENHQIDSLIVGVGVNLLGRLPENLTTFAGTVFKDKLPHDLNLNSLVIHFVKNFLEIHSRQLDAHFLDEYRKRLLGIGQWVKFAYDGQDMRGEILGINDSGHLQVRTNQQILNLMGSEIHFDSQIFMESLE